MVVVVKEMPKMSEGDGGEGRQREGVTKLAYMAAPTPVVWVSAMHGKTGLRKGIAAKRSALVGYRNQLKYFGRLQRTCGADREGQKGHVDCLVRENERCNEHTGADLRHDLPPAQNTSALPSG